VSSSITAAPQLGRLQDVLRRDASALAFEGRLPVDVMELVRRLGLGLVVEPSLNHQHGGALRRSGRGWDVVVNRDEARLSASQLTERERFTVAHEVAHYLIEGRFGIRPRSGSEYWGIEDLCNDFASRLLIPDFALKAALAASPEIAKDYLGVVVRLTKSARVSLEAAARRLLQSTPSPFVVLSMSIERDSSKGMAGQLLWCVQSYEWVGSKRGSRVRGNHPLVAAVASAQARSEGEMWGLQLGEKLDAFAQRLTGRRFIVAAVLPQQLTGAAIRSVEEAGVYVDPPEAVASAPL